MTVSIMRLNNNTRKFLKWAAVALLWLAIWQLASAAVGKELLIPSPKAAFLSLKELCVTADFWLAVLLSVLRIIAGYLSGVLAGVAGAVLSARFSAFKAVFSPVLHLIRAVPVASFIILALVWIKSQYLAVFISFLMVLPMIWTTVETGIENLDRRYLEMAEVFRISPLKTLFQVKIPFILPSFIASATSALGFAWKSGVAAEVICRPENSLGRLLQDAKTYLETPRVFAVTAVVALLSLILELAVKRAARRFTDVKH